MALIFIMEYILEILEAKANTVLNKNIDFITLYYYMETYGLETFRLT